MKFKAFTGIMLTLLLTSMLTLALNIQPAKAFSQDFMHNTANDNYFGYAIKGRSRVSGINIFTSHFTCNRDGIAKNITACLNTTLPHQTTSPPSFPAETKVAIYSCNAAGAPENLLDYSNEVTISHPFDGWKTFILTQNTVLSNNTKYFLSVWSSNVYVFTYFDAGGKNQYCETWVPWDVFPNPFPKPTWWTDRKLSIYCGYDPITNTSNTSSNGNVLDDTTPENGDGDGDNDDGAPIDPTTDLIKMLGFGIVIVACSVVLVILVYRRHQKTTENMFDKPTKTQSPLFL